MPKLRTVQLIVAILAGFAAVSSSCRCNDAFECGVQIGSDITRCSRADEFCICTANTSSASNRCARVDSSCPSQYAFVFPESDAERCVDSADLAVAIPNEATGSAAICPGEKAIPPKCGVRVSGSVLSCPDPYVCLCDQGICARYNGIDQTCPWRRATDDACLAPAEHDPNHRPGDDGICPSTNIPEPEVVCGKVDNGSVMSCGENERCICNGKYRCAFSDAESCPDTRLRYRSSDPNQIECVLAEDSPSSISSGLCLEDRPPRTACGSPVDGGATDCPLDTQRCICSTGFCAENVPGATCASTFRYSGSGECVAAEDQNSAIDSGSCAPMCGTKDPSGRIMNCKYGDCICGIGAGRCAIPDAECPSGRSYVDDKNCVIYSTTTAAQIIADGDLCPSKLDEIACGTAGQDSRVARCGPEQQCACSEGAGFCVEFEPSCDSGRAYRPSNRCFDPMGMSLIDSGLCPGATTASITCGAVDMSSGRILECAEGERCVCRGAGDFCARPDPGCPSGLAGAHDEVCVPLKDDDYLIAIDGRRLCPQTEPEVIPCAEDVEEECGADTVCICAGETGRCAFDQPACASGYQLMNTGQCETEIAPDESIVREGGCASSIRAGVR